MISPGGAATMAPMLGNLIKINLLFLVACLLGLPAKNYEDGFYGWSDSATNTIERGASWPAGS